LDDCNLTVRQGECVFLLGPSGSGKTTLLSIMGCVLSADQGDVVVLGQYVREFDPQQAAAFRLRHLGFVFQRYHLIHGLNALENVCVPLTLAGASRPTAQRRGRELLELVGLGDHAASLPRRMSVGQCQRVALARALAADPPLILADEPTAALDAESGQAAMRLLRRVTADVGKTAVVVTHDPRVLPFADRIFVMDNGRLAESSPPVDSGLELTHAPDDASHLPSELQPC
jgi:putative ABC transport system ATP-binding protein